MKEIIKKFDLELAKKITSGEIKGIIRTKNNNFKAKLLISDINSDFPLAFILTDRNGKQSIYSYALNGSYTSCMEHEMDLEIVLFDEISNEFNPGDILCTSYDDSKGDTINLYFICSSKNNDFSYNFYAMIDCINEDTKLYLYDSISNTNFRKATTDECKFFHAKLEVFSLRWNSDEMELEQMDNFVPFQKVLVRDNDNSKWDIELFSSYVIKDSYPYRCLASKFKMCIPYNNYTETLLGTYKEYLKK